MILFWITSMGTSSLPSFIVCPPRIPSFQHFLQQCHHLLLYGLYTGLDLVKRPRRRIFLELAVEIDPIPPLGALILKQLKARHVFSILEP
jgi:hypothetical protein